MGSSERDAGPKSRFWLAGDLSGGSREEIASKVHVVGRIQFHVVMGLKTLFLAGCWLGFVFNSQGLLFSRPCVQPLHLQCRRGNAMGT